MAPPKPPPADLEGHHSTEMLPPAMERSDDMDSLPATNIDTIEERFFKEYSYKPERAGQFAFLQILSYVLAFIFFLFFGSSASNLATAWENEGRFVTTNCTIINGSFYENKCQRRGNRHYSSLYTCYCSSWLVSYDFEGAGLTTTAAPVTHYHPPQRSLRRHSDIHHHARNHTSLPPGQGRMAAPKCQEDQLEAEAEMEALPTGRMIACWVDQKSPARVLSLQPEGPEYNYPWTILWLFLALVFWFAARKTFRLL